MSDIKLFHGNCYEIIPTLPDKSIDLIVTDPPYDFKAQITGRGMFSDKNAERYGRKRAVGMLNELEELDSTRFEPRKFLDMIKPKMERFYAYIFCNKTLVPDYLNWVLEQKFSFDILVLNKVNPVPAHSTHHVSDLEYIILIRDKKSTYFKGSGLEFDNYRKFYQTTCKKRIHPAEKPVELLERFVRVSCPENGTVLDCFMGSGSTGIACLNNGRNFIGVEKNDEYFELAKKRIKDREDEINGVGSLFEGIA